MDVSFYCETNGQSPVRSWLNDCRISDPDMFDAAYDLIRRLTEEGHLLREPFSKPLGDGLFELRDKTGDVQLRIFFCFHGNGLSVLLHQLIKKTQKTPASALALARKRMSLLKQNPSQHLYRQTFGNTH